MLVLDYLLISNGPQDGNVLFGTFAPAKGDEASKLTLHFPHGEVVVEGDEASLLFDYYVQTGKRIGPAQYVTITTSALDRLQEFFERYTKGAKAFSDPITERRQLAESCYTIIKNLKDRILRTY